MNNLVAVDFQNVVCPPTRMQILKRNDYEISGFVEKARKLGADIMNVSLRATIPRDLRYNTRTSLDVNARYYASQRIDGSEAIILLRQPEKIIYLPIGMDEKGFYFSGRNPSEGAWDQLMEEGIKRAETCSQLGIETKLMINIPADAGYLPLVQRLLPYETFSQDIELKSKKIKKN